jgi:hypothetical protein
MILEELRTVVFPDPSQIASGRKIKSAHHPQ